MKNANEIKKRLSSEKKDLGKRTVLYECAGDYERGWVAALKWVLDTAPQPSVEADAESREPCYICGGVGKHEKYCSRGK